MVDTKKTNRGGILSKRVTLKECGDTGMAMVLICLLAGLFTGSQGWFIGATVLLVINMTWPRIYSLAAGIWLGFSHLLGTIMSKVILTLVFFVMVTPLALLRRVLGHDPMRLKQWKGGTDSVFETRDHTYSPKEIEQPF